MALRGYFLLRRKREVCLRYPSPMQPDSQPHKEAIRVHDLGHLRILSLIGSGGVGGGFVANAY